LLNHAGHDSLASEKMSFEVDLIAPVPKVFGEVGQWHTETPGADPGRVFRRTYPKCQTKNPEGSSFCRECGQLLRGEQGRIREAPFEEERRIRDLAPDSVFKWG